MRYVSTRGGEDSLSFEQAVLTGLAPNGGLYIPHTVPTLPPNWDSLWSSYSFQDLSHAILSLYIPESEISSAHLRALVNKSYATFRHPEVAPLHQIKDKEFVLELWHGPTFAFKDVALQFLGNLFEFFLQRKNEGKSGPNRETLTVLGATSGDTGSAAIYGLRSKADVDIFILHPKNRVSPIQEAQMTTITDSNVHNIAVKATFDDCQDIVKSLFADKIFNEKYHLGAVNSINWARILAQMVYYFLAYFHVKKQLEKIDSDATIQFVVPTGNFGDVLAGWYAKRMGLPAERLVVATNSNDILARFWASGRYEKHPASTSNVTGGVLETLSPAMDILVSSNFERLLWYLVYDSLAGSLSSDDAQRRSVASKTVKGWMDNVKADGRAVVSEEVLALARKDFVAERVDDTQTIETIQAYYKAENGFSDVSYIADPHTAVGLTAARRLAGNNPPSVQQVILSTAHPAKFSEAVTRALAPLSASFDFERDVLPEEFRGLLQKERRVIDIEKPEVGLVKDAIVQALVASGKVFAEASGV